MPRSIPPWVLSEIAATTNWQNAQPIRSCIFLQEPKFQSSFSPSIYVGLRWTVRPSWVGKADPRSERLRNLLQNCVQVVICKKLKSHKYILKENTKARFASTWMIICQNVRNRETLRKLHKVCELFVLRNTHKYEHHRTIRYSGYSNRKQWYNGPLHVAPMFLNPLLT